MEAKAYSPESHKNSPPPFDINEIEVNLRGIEKPPHIPDTAEIDVDVSEFSEKDPDFGDFEALDRTIKAEATRKAIARLPDYTKMVRDTTTPPPMPPPTVDRSQEMKLSPELYDWMYNKKDSFKALGEEQGIAIAADGTVKGWNEKRKLNKKLANNPLLKARFETLKTAQAKKQEEEETARQGTLARQEVQQNPMNVKPVSKLKRWGQRLAFALGLTATGGALGNVVSSVEDQRTEAAMRQANNNAAKAFGQSRVDLSQHAGGGTVDFTSVPSDPVSFQTMKEMEINPTKQFLKETGRAVRHMVKDNSAVNIENISAGPITAKQVNTRSGAPLTSEHVSLPKDALQANVVPPVSPSHEKGFASFPQSAANDAEITAQLQADLERRSAEMQKRQEKLSEERRQARKDLLE